MQQHMEGSISSLQNEIMILRESNKELIQLLFPKRSNTATPQALHTLPKKHFLAELSKLNQLDVLVRETENKVSDEELAESTIKQTKIDGDLEVIQREIMKNVTDLGIERPLETSVKDKQIKSNMQRESQDDSEWKHQKSKKNRYQTKFKQNNESNRRGINIGTANTHEAEDFSGKEDNNKKIWLFISRVKDHVTEAKIKKYIKDKTKLEDDKDIVVEHIKTKYDDIRKDCQCFKVGVHYDKKEMVYDTNFWPKKVAYRRFDFDAKTRMADEKDF